VAKASLPQIIRATRLMAAGYRNGRGNVEYVAAVAHAIHKERPAIERVNAAMASLRRSSEDLPSVTEVLRVLRQPLPSSDVA